MTATSAAPARQGSKAYLGASFVAQFCALARYMLLARLLGPEQLGIAVALILTTQFMESVTDSGGDRFLIQDKQGDETRAQKLVHVVFVLRGVFIAAALIALSGPLAAYYDEPALQTGLVILALAPLVAGLAHLDYRRVQRNSDFRPESWTLLASEIASLIVTGIAAVMTRDYTAILFGLITRALIITIVSHIVAERRYALGFAREHAGRLSRFALPLMLNGLLLFLSSQGDRVLIGGEVGLKELGYYSAALLLIFYPAGMLQRYIGAVHLPLISGPELQADKARAADRLGSQTLLLAVSMAAGFTLFAPVALPLLFGARFEQPAMIIAAIAVLQLSRFMRVWLITGALALGRSGTVLATNFLRLSAFPLAFLGLEWIGGMPGILVAFIAAECVTLIITVAIVSRQFGRSMLHAQDRALLFTLASALIIATAARWDAGALADAGLLFALTTFLLVAIVWKERRVVSDLRQVMLRR